MLNFMRILKNTMKGIFITFEGIDGSGKSTQVVRLADYLEKHGLEVVLTREPGGTRVAEKIRSILLDRNHIELSARAELLLYLASRAQHTVEIIKPALESGKWVISDRFSDSSIAYQGCARGLGMDIVQKMTLIATDNLIPDLTFFLDISPRKAESRMKIQGKILDRLEKEKGEFMKSVRQGYLQISLNEPERFISINAEQTIDDVWCGILQVLCNRFPCFRDG